MVHVPTSQMHVDTSMHTGPAKDAQQHTYRHPSLPSTFYRAPHPHLVHIQVHLLKLPTGQQLLIHPLVYRQRTWVGCVWRLVVQARQDMYRQDSAAECLVRGRHKQQVPPPNKHAVPVYSNQFLTHPVVCCTPALTTAHTCACTRGGRGPAGTHACWGDGEGVRQRDSENRD